jgi:hypothetical protein
MSCISSRSEPWSGICAFIGAAICLDDGGDAADGSVHSYNRPSINSSTTRYDESVDLVTFHRPLAFRCKLPSYPPGSGRSPDMPFRTRTRPPRFRAQGLRLRELLPKRIRHGTCCLLASDLDRHLGITQTLYQTYFQARPKSRV